MPVDTQPWVQIPALPLIKAQGSVPFCFGFFVYNWNVILTSQEFGEVTPENLCLISLGLSRRIFNMRAVKLHPRVVARRPGDGRHAALNGRWYVLWKRGHDLEHL